MKKPRVLIFAGYGLNCEEDTQFAFELAGATADIVHINDLIAKPKLLQKYQILAFPGGFSYGDDTGSGNAYASKLRNHLWSEIEAFVKKDTLVIGICNGFQILVSLGLLPAIDTQYGARQVSLLANTSARYTVRWVDVQVTNDSPWLKKIDTLSLPIAHGEGRLYADAAVRKTLADNQHIALKYISGEVCEYHTLPANPNGALDDIAGITDKSGKVFGLMPHPERSVAFTHLPHWTLLKEESLRTGKKLPKYGPGLAIFKNAVQYFN